MCLQRHPAAVVEVVVVAVVVTLAMAAMVVLLLLLLLLLARPLLSWHPCSNSCICRLRLRCPTQLRRRLPSPSIRSSRARRDLYPLPLLPRLLAGQRVVVPALLVADVVDVVDVLAPAVLARVTGRPLCTMTVYIWVKALLPQLRSVGTNMQAQSE